MAKTTLPTLERPGVLLISLITVHSVTCSLSQLGFLASKTIHKSSKEKVAFHALAGPHQTRQGRAQLGGPVLPGFLRWNSRIASLAFLISVAKFQVGLWPPAHLTRYS